MKIAIKNPAPLNKNQRLWGDYHFGISLQGALERNGAHVVQHFWPEWDRDADEDVVLVLRGWHRHTPPAGKVSILWVISHPALVTKEELDSYTLVYSASSTFRAIVRGVTTTPVEVLRQCTDPSVFFAPDRGLREDLQRRDGVVFVASGRGTRRDMAHWAIRSGTPFTVVGRNWEQQELGPQTVRGYVANPRVGEIYRSARLSLNDHWMDMRRFGIINNRVFDCLACGLPVLSDSFPELRGTFTDGVLYANSGSEFAVAMNAFGKSYEGLLEGARIAADQVRSRHSFDARAEQIVAQALVPPSRAQPPSAILIEDKVTLHSALTDSIAQDEQQIEDLKRDLIESESEIRSLECHRIELERRLNAKIKALVATIEGQQTRVSSLLDSRSWRVTAPMRLVSRAGKRFLRKITRYQMTRLRRQWLSRRREM